jgi:hypothetical protein
MTGTTKENGGARAARLAGRWLPPILLAAAFAAMLAFSWAKWPDVLVDFGHELYVAWQISQGKALVRDFFFSNTGPLSPYLNGLLFAVVGPSMRALFVANLLLLVVLTWILFRLLEAYAGRLGATAGCLAMLVLFAFGQYVGIGNYNYVAPYSHGVTHGLLLSLLSLWLAWRWLAGAPLAFLAGASLCLGGVFLTKPEAFVAAVAGLLPAAILALRRGSGAGNPARVLAAALLPAMAVPLAAFGLLLLQLPPADAARAALLPWVMLSTPGTKIPFYASGMGTDDLAGNLGRMATWGLLWALPLGAAALADARLPRQAAVRRWLPVVAFAVVAAGLAWAVPVREWYGVGRPLPLVCLAGAATFLVLLRRTDPADPRAPGLALGAMLWCFAGAQLLKMAFNARIQHYGFALAMPAFVMAVATCAGPVPAWLRRRGGAGSLFQGVAAALLVAVVAAYLQIAAGIYRQKTDWVGEGADAFLADPRGRFVNGAIQAISAHGRPGDTLAVIPEGVMINYLTRRVNPTPFIEYMPDAIAWMGSEGPMLAAHARTPPDLILLVHRDNTEHGATFFGRDFARSTMAWIDENYQVAQVIGAVPLRDRRYGMMLLVRQTGR